MPKRKYIFKRGEIWHFDKTVAGERIRCSLKTSNEKEAARIAAEIEARKHREALYGAEKEYTFAQACIEYLNDGGCPTRLEPILKAIGKRKLGTITPGEIRTLAKKIYPTAGAPMYNRWVITPVQAIINHVHDKGWCSPIKIKRFPEPKPVKVAVTRDWIDTFIAGARPNVGTAMFFMYTTGARIGETVKINEDTINYDKAIAWQDTTKTGEPRTYYLTDELMTMMQALNQKPGVGIFGYSNPASLRIAIKSECAKIGLEYVPPHQSGRHSFATEMIIRNNIDPVTTAAIGGWKDPSVLLKTYSHAEDMDNVVRGVFGTKLTQEKKKA